MHDSRLEALEMKGLRQCLRVAYMDSKKANNWVLEKAGLLTAKKSFIKHKTRKLRHCDHIVKHNCFKNDIVRGLYPEE